MIRALYSAASGMIAQQANLEMVSNNLANVNTTGFKKSRAEFQDLLYAQVQAPIAGRSTGLEIGQGSRLSSLYRVLSGGALQVTGGTYDMAIQGDGFFRVQQENGTVAYTRDGAFHLDAQGRLASAGGGLVLGDNGPITIPAQAGNVQVTGDGNITYTDAKGQTVTAAKLSLATFVNPTGLATIGDNLLTEQAASGQPRLVAPGAGGTGRLAQGTLEASNVDAAEEMINMMQAQRAYQLNSRVIQSADEMMSLANNLRRG
jgi:flagellar basal-body rod protein FlgG